MPDSSWPETPEATGHSAVDALLDVLPGLAGTPVSGHGAVYAALHEGLLTELNSESGAPAGVAVPGGPRAAR